MNCPNECKDVCGKPAQMKGGKIISTKSGRMVRWTCPVCWNFIWKPEEKK